MASNRISSTALEADTACRHVDRFLLTSDGRLDSTGFNCRTDWPLVTSESVDHAPARQLKAYAVEDYQELRLSFEHLDRIQSVNGGCFAVQASCLADEKRLIS